MEKLMTATLETPTHLRVGLNVDALTKEPLPVPSPLAEHLPTLLWDVNPSTINPQAMYRTIIERVIQRGSKGDWAAMLAYYGHDVVQRVVETEPYMSDAGIAAVCQFFKLKKEDLLCYQRKQLMPQTFNS